MVITGAGPGIMEAGIEGAGVENSFGVGIQLPFEAATTQFLADDPKLINFRYFFTRKLTFVKEADGFVLLPGGFGTLDEAFELLTLVQTGKAQITPIVLLDVPGGTYWHRWLEFITAELGARSYISPGRHDAVPHHRRHERRARGAHELLLQLPLAALRRRQPGAAPATRTRTRSRRRLNAEFADIVVRGHIERIDATRVEIAEQDSPTSRACASASTATATSGCARSSTRSTVVADAIGLPEPHSARGLAITKRRSSTIRSGGW